MSLVDFELTDAAGGVHRYEVMLHPTREGMKVIRSLARILAGPLGAAIEGAAKSAGGPAALLAAVGAGKVEGLDLDLSALAPALGDAIERIPEDLELLVLRHTSRDGRPLVIDGRLTVTYDSAYQANYGELLQALRRVIGANRFIPGLS